MAYDHAVAERVREALDSLVPCVEKRMFGGLAFMVNGHMCCGVQDDELMLRVGPEQYESVLERPFAKPMDFTGKPLRGFVYVQPEGFEQDADLLEWLHCSLAFVTRLPPKD